MNIHFLTFANSSYVNSSHDIPERILKQAKSFYKFKSIYHWNEADIADLIERHKYHFSLFKDDGFGRWLWKPYIILKRLSELEEGEILLYMDAGSHLNSEGLERFQNYLNILNTGDNKIIAFQVNDYYRGKFYVKADCVNEYFPEFYNQDFPVYASGIILVKNSKFTKKLIGDWLGLCEYTHFLNPGKSLIHQDPIFFKGQDGDNGLYNLVLAKFQTHYKTHGGITSIYPDEVILYHKNGKQLIHAVDFKKYFCADWSELNSYPFHARRDRPAKKKSGRLKLVITKFSQFFRIIR